MSLGTLLGGGGGGGKASSSTTIPKWLKPIVKPLYIQSANIGGQIANQGYTKYGGQRVAGLNSGQQDAITGINNNRFNPLSMQSKQYTSDTLAGKNLQGNPYLEGMIGVGNKSIADNYNKTLRPQMDANIARQGAFGGSGWMQANNDMNQQLAEQLANNDTTNRFNNYNMERGYQNQAAGDAANWSNQDLAGQQAALQANSLQQGLDQQQMDINNADFNEQRDWLFRALQGLQGGLGNVEGLYGKSGKSSGDGNQGLVGMAGSLGNAYSEFK